MERVPAPSIKQHESTSLGMPTDAHSNEIDSRGDPRAPVVMPIPFEGLTPSREFPVDGQRPHSMAGDVENLCPHAAARRKIEEDANGAARRRIGVGRVQLEPRRGARGGNARDPTWGGEPARGAAGALPGGPPATPPEG